MAVETAPEYRIRDNAVRKVDPRKLGERFASRLCPAVAVSRQLGTDVEID